MMRKSNKCSYTLVKKGKVILKRKFLRPEEAIDEAERINKQERTIHKFEAYKCTQCFFFHVGRSKKEINKPSINGIINEALAEIITSKTINLPIKKELIDEVENIEEKIEIELTTIPIEKDFNTEGVIIRNDFNWDKDVTKPKKIK